jgi:hypothetical protein
VATAALAVFGFMWWGLQSAAEFDLGGAVGVAIVPFTLVLTLGGVWADRARSRRENVDRVDTEPVSPGGGSIDAAKGRVGYRLRGNAKVQSERPRIRNQDVAFDVSDHAQLHDRDADIK